MEREIQLVVLPRSGSEYSLGHQHTRPAPNHQPRLLLKLTCQSRSGRFSKLDVPTGQVVVPVLPVLAKQHSIPPNQHPARNHLDLSF